MAKEWVRSWSHAFLIAYHKTLSKKLLAIRLEKVTRRKKEKTRKAITKLFALNANAIRGINVQKTCQLKDILTKIIKMNADIFANLINLTIV